jgi:hypothetical protein
MGHICYASNVHEELLYRLIGERWWCVIQIHIGHEGLLHDFVEWDDVVDGEIHLSVGKDQVWLGVVNGAEVVVEWGAEVRFRFSLGDPELGERVRKAVFEASPIRNWGVVNGR